MNIYVSFLFDITKDLFYSKQINTSLNNHSPKKIPSKTIIFFTDTIGIGGAEEYLKILALGVNKEKFNIRIAIPENKGTEEFVNDLRSKGVRIDFINKYNLVSNYIYFLKNKPDYIHFNLPFPNKCISALLAGIIYSKSKLYLTEHLVPQDYVPNKILKEIKKYIYNKICLSIAVSAKNKESLIKNFDLPEDKIKIVYNSVDADPIKNYDVDILNELRNKFTLSDSSIVYGTVGRLNKQKGHEYLIDAAKKLIEKVPGSIFLIVGKGQLKDQLIQKTKDNDIYENFRFVGYQKNLPEILAIMDIFVLPSINEGFPFALLEAMAAKKPIIATNVGGVTEIVKNGVNGIVVEPMDPFALSTAMLELAVDAKKRMCFAEEGYKTILANFTLEKMISSTEQIYT